MSGINNTTLVASCLLVLIVSCQDNLDLITEGVSEPVVYGIINPDDSINYIRLSKTFIGNASVESLAKDPKNIYYDNVVMNLDINTNEGFPVKSFSMDQVVMRDRQEGLFAPFPNIMYCLSGKIISFLLDDYQIRLCIVLPKENRMISAQQIYHKPPAILNPKPSLHSYLSLYYTDPVRIQWEDLYGFKKYEIIVRFNFKEHFMDSTRYSYVDLQSIEYSKVKESDQKDKTLSYYFYGDDLLHIVDAKIKDDVHVINRSFTDIDIIVTAMGEEFCEYQETNAIASDGFGRPVSNIVNGLGVFALRLVSVRRGYLLDPISLDSLVLGKFTNKLRFVKW